MTSSSESGNCVEQNSGRSGVMATHTGLFISWEKSFLLIQTIQDVLRNKYKTCAKIGSRLPNNTAEIILYSQQSSGSNISGAKHLLESYLSMINESKPKVFFGKKPEVIEIDGDEDLTCIVLDDSVNEPGTQGHIESTRKVNSITQNIIIDSENQNSTRSRCINNTNHNFESIAGRNSAKKGVKRKHSSDKDVQILDDDDDDVIVLDTSLSSNNNLLNKHVVNNSCSLNGKNFIDLTGNSSSVVITASNEPSKKSKNKTYQNKHFKTTNTPCISKSSSSLLEGQIVNKKASKSLVTNTTSKPSTSVTCDVNDKSNGNETCIKSSATKSTPAKSCKKVSKLKYKRPAHLIVPLTESSQKDSTSDSQSNMYNPNAGLTEKKTGLRPIVIDGNNVGVSYGKGQFSLKGVEICINYFEKRGHRQIKAFIPHYRTNRDTFDRLNKLQHQGTVVVTPSRKVNGKTIASYDDRYIVQYAAEFGGVIVSTDNYRDLVDESPSWRETIENRLLMFTWVDDLLMFPQDPLGRKGPTLNEFLKFPDS